MRYSSLWAVPAALVMIAPALALDATPYDAAKFQAAQEAGKPILIDITAPWCPVCKAQKPILSRLMKKPENKNFIVFSVDFDSQKDVLRRFNANRQSTLIVFKGKVEVGRSTGDTNPGSIELLIDSATTS